MGAVSVTTALLLVFSLNYLICAKVFKIGFIAPWDLQYDFSAYTSASALSIAIDRVNADPSLNADGLIELSSSRIIVRDSMCNSKVTAGKAVDLIFNETVDVIIGDPCSAPCRAVAELASYFDIPVISWVATDPDFNDKSIYTTFARTLGPFDKMGTFLVEIFKQYKWNRVVVISSNYLLWLDASKAIKIVFRDHNISIAYQPEYDRNPSDSYITATLTKTKEEGRIVMLINPKEERRRFMLKAYDLGMTSGDYVFYTIEMLPEQMILNAEAVWKGNDGRDKEAKLAFEAVFHVTLAALTGEEVTSFREEVAKRMRQPPWDKYVNDAHLKNPQLGSGLLAETAKGDKYSPFLHDTIILYAIALNETLRRGQDITNGTQVAMNMRAKFFKGISGNVVLDFNGDREPDYWISDMNPATGEFLRIAEVVNTDDGIREFRKDLRSPTWPGGKVGHQFAPPDVPLCGFRDELCQGQAVESWIIIISIAASICVITGAIVGAVFIFRCQRFENMLLMLSWRIKYEEIEMVKGGKSMTSFQRDGSGLDKQSTGSSASRSLGGLSLARSVPSIGTQQQLFTDVGYYKGVLVAMKHIKKEHMQLTRLVLLEFNEMKGIIFENLNVFVGACIDPPNICLIWNYCSKGSLQDVVANDGVKLDNVFKFSFMADICKGITFLHKSALLSHGNLKSSNCLIDSRWNVKVTDYGLPSFLAGQNLEDNEHINFKRKVWTAPELLRENFPPPRGTQKGDVYSFSIICYEIMQRTEPYNFEHMTPKDAVNRVRNGESIPFRPILPESVDLGRAMLDLLKLCWSESPDNRPSFNQIRAALRKIAGGEVNIMDNILGMMEKYAYNLEEIVDERTSQLVEEKKKTDRLLYRMLPATVAEQLKAGKFVQPENYDQSTIYFSDIVGFTTLSSDSNPMQIVDFLNDLYSCFDDIIAKHDVYKVETIGDAYMVVSGVPIRNGTRHTAEIANVSLDLLSAVTSFKIRHRPQQQLQLRIGLHMGPVVAGCVGLIMPRYCLFGDTVHMAALMESNGKPLRIHISRACHIALKESGQYDVTLRGEMNVKGKGLQTTYWLHGKKGYDKPLPAFDDMDDQPTGGKFDSKKEGGGGTKGFK